MSLSFQPHPPALRRRSLGWLLPFQAAAALTAFAVTSGGQALRGLLLGALACLMALPLLSSLEAGLVALMLFEPNRGLLRRAQYLIVDYAQMDPIHALSPAVTLVAFAALLRVRGLAALWETKLAAPFSALTLIYVLQIFNPLQGGVGVGISGVMFMLVPMFWFYFGQAVKPQFMATALKLLIALGLVCSLHGIYQLAYGFPSFEQYWIEHTEFYESIAVGRVQRALATFSSAEEWGRYIEFGALAAFGFALGARQKLAGLGYLTCGLALSAMLFVTGQRSSIFGLIFGVGVLALVSAPTLRSAVSRAALLCLCGLLVVTLAKPPSEDDMWSKGSDEKFETMLSHSARGTLNPAKEESLQARFEMWTNLMTRVVPYRPLGHGLGAGSLASVRFNNLRELMPIDSFLVVVIIACGLPAAALFVWILGRAALLAIAGARGAEPHTPEAAVARIAAALVPVLILNNLIGLTFSIYSCAPVGWLLVGWVSAEATRRERGRGGAGEGESGGEEEGRSER
jgi:hypothetical protein